MSIAHDAVASAHFLGIVNDIPLATTCQDCLSHLTNDRCEAKQKKKREKDIRSGVGEYCNLESDTDNLFQETFYPKSSNS